MNKYVKEFFLRGLLFGGFGPMVCGIVLWIVQLTDVKVLLSDGQILLAIASTYVLAFVQAGASVFNQVESWPIAKSMAFHFLSLYVVYVACYLANSWIPFQWQVVAIFTAIFVVVYFVVWVTVYLIVKNTSKQLNKKLAK